MDEAARPPVAAPPLGYRRTSTPGVAGVAGPRQGGPTLLQVVVQLPFDPADFGSASRSFFLAGPTLGLGQPRFVPRLMLHSSTLIVS